MGRLASLRRRLAQWIDPDDPDEFDSVFLVLQGGVIDVYGPSWTFRMVRKKRGDADRIYRKTVKNRGDDDV